MIASERGEAGLAAGTGLLRAGASPLDAAEAAIRVVDADEDNHTVGVGGLPNLPDQFRSPLQAPCLTPDGRHGGAPTIPGATYGVMTAGDTTFRIEDRRQP